MITKAGLLSVFISLFKTGFFLAILFFVLAFPIAGIIQMIKGRSSSNNDTQNSDKKPEDDDK